MFWDNEFVLMTYNLLLFKLVNRVSCLCLLLISPASNYTLFSLGLHCGFGAQYKEEFLSPHSCLKEIAPFSAGEEDGEISSGLTFILMSFPPSPLDSNDYRKGSSTLLASGLWGCFC